VNIPKVKVIETTDRLGIEEVVRKHPAFGTIGASRVSGHATLAGSPLKHHGFITIRVSFADERVSHTHSHFYERERVVELSISEAQWAAFVSTLNVGSGVPCTLEWVREGTFKRLPLIEDESFEDRRANDIKRCVKKNQEQLDAAVAFLDDLLAKGVPASRKALKELRDKFIQPVDNAPNNAEFLADMLTEHTEELIESAKAEVSAMVTRVALQYPQLEGHGVEIHQIEDKTETE
jgi:hypothetical protein